MDKNFKSNFGKWQTKILEEIKSLNFENQNQVLLEMGFTRLSQNLKYLKRYEGNVDLVVQKLTNKHLKEGSPDETPSKEKEFKEKNQFHHHHRFHHRHHGHHGHHQRKGEDILKKLGIEEQNKALEEAGFTNPRRNIKALMITQGDVKKAIEILNQKNDKEHLGKEEKEKIALEKIKELGFELQNQQLFDKGYTRLSRNVKILAICKGDADKALFMLEGTGRGWGERREKKEKKEKQELAPVVEYEKLPDNITRVYLDGNNMLFVEGAIRRLCLRRKTSSAEIVISDIAWEFASALKRIDLVLVYDRTNLSISKKIEGSKTYDFKVLSASPNYDISDDALVDWAQKLGNEAKNSLFVTSDRELQRRLLAAGVSDIMKPGRWFSMVKTLIGEEKYESLIPKKEEK